MSVIANTTAVGGVLDSASSLTKDLMDLSANPNGSVAQAQVNADLQNLAAAATSVIPGVGASTAFAALSADVTLMLTKIVNGVVPEESDFLAAFGNVATIVGQVVSAAGLAETVLTGGAGLIPGLGAITLGTAVDFSAAGLTGLSLGVDRENIQATLSAFSSALRSLGANLNSNASQADNGPVLSAINNPSSNTDDSLADVLALQIFPLPSGSDVDVNAAARTALSNALTTQLGSDTVGAYSISAGSNGTVTVDAPNGVVINFNANMSGSIINPLDSNGSYSKTFFNSAGQPQSIVNNTYSTDAQGNPILTISNYSYVNSQPTLSNSSVTQVNAATGNTVTTVDNNGNGIATQIETTQ